MFLIHKTQYLTHGYNCSFSIETLDVSVVLKAFKPAQCILVIEVNMAPKHAVLKTLASHFKLQFPFHSHRFECGVGGCFFQSMISTEVSSVSFMKRLKKLPENDKSVL